MSLPLETSTPPRPGLAGLGLPVPSLSSNTRPETVAASARAAPGAAVRAAATPPAARRRASRREISLIPSIDIFWLRCSWNRVELSAPSREAIMNARSLVSTHRGRAPCPPGERSSACLIHMKVVYSVRRRPMTPFSSPDLQKRDGDNQRSATKESIASHGNPRKIVMSNEEVCGLEERAREETRGKAAPRRAANLRAPDDPLGYDMTDYDSAVSRMIDDVRSGRTDDAVASELENVRRLFDGRA